MVWIQHCDCKKAETQIWSAFPSRIHPFRAKLCKLMNQTWVRHPSYAFEMVLWWTATKRLTLQSFLRSHVCGRMCAQMCTNVSYLRKVVVSWLRNSFGVPDLGSAEGCRPDLFRFVPIFLFSSELFRFALLVVGNTPIYSDLLRFLSICFQNKSEQIRETPFCRPLVQVPDSFLLAIPNL